MSDRKIWTKEMDDKLFHFRVVEKLTAAQIGERLGVTKSAVCGRVRRNGWANPEANPVNAQVAKKTILKKRRQRTRPKTFQSIDQKKMGYWRRKSFESALEAAERGEISLPDDLPKVSSGCRYIYGDPKDVHTKGFDGIFCNSVVVTGKSYCEFHDCVCTKHPQHEEPADEE